MGLFQDRWQFRIGKIGIFGSASVNLVDKLGESAKSGNGQDRGIGKLANSGNRQLRGMGKIGKSVESRNRQICKIGESAKISPIRAAYRIGLGSGIGRLSLENFLSDRQFRIFLPKSPPLYQDFLSRVFPASLKTPIESRNRA